MIIKKLKVKIPFFANFLFTAFLVLFLLQAYMHDKNIVYIFVFFVLAIVMNNYFFLRKNLKGIEFRYVSIENSFAKGVSKIHFRVENPSSFDRYDIRVDEKFSFNIKANSSIDIFVEHKFDSRGRVSLPTIEISSIFPMYLFDHYYAKLEIDRDLIIYPAKIGKSIKDFFGANRTLFGERDDFKGIREYNESDNISLIHWKSVAKGQLMSKEFEYVSANDSYEFDIDKIYGSLEVKLSQLTLWVVEADKKGYEYRVKIQNTTLDSNQKSIKEILLFLALYGKNDVK